MSKIGPFGRKIDTLAALLLRGLQGLALWDLWVPAGGALASRLKIRIGFGNFNAMNSVGLSGKELAHYVVSLGKTKEESHLEELITYLSSPNGNVRRLACSALGKIKSPKAETHLLKLLDDPQPQVRQYAIKALGVLAGNKTLPKLADITNNSDERNYNIRAAKLASMKILRRAGRREVLVAASEISDFDYCNLKWQFKKKYRRFERGRIENEVFQKLLQRKQVLDRGERLHQQHTARPAVVSRWGWVILLISLIFLLLLLLGGLR